MKYKLYEEKQAHATMLAVWNIVKETLYSGKKVILEIKEETRTNEQNALMHTLIARIAKQAEHAGSKWEPEDWKRLLLAMWSKDMGRIVPSLDGEGVVQLGLQSRSLTKAEGAEFIEFIYAWAAQAGIDMV
jgi:hypothetical protein